jgi:hypothetical protein|tara:strand:- start:20 stop:316 length:297 start_codon:yes stop_codon:yes gene_type:complete
MSIKQKYFGNLQLDNLGKAVKTIPSKVEKTDKYGHQIKVKATMWEDGGITIDIWDAENKVAHKLGKLMLDKEFVKPSPKTFNGEDLIKREIEDTDLPF